MKTIFIMLISLLLFVGCSSQNNDNNDKISMDDVYTEVKRAAEMENLKEEDITDLDIIKRYGLSKDDIEEGRVFYSSNEEIADKIIIVKAKNKDAIENIEKALSSEIVGMTNTWESNEAESKKTENHILKTTGNYITLIVSENSEKIEALLDKMLK